MNSAMIQEEEGKLLKRHTPKPKKPYFIESRMPNTTIRAFREWSRSGRYETKVQRDQALHDLQKSAHSRDHLLFFEYRAPEMS